MEVDAVITRVKTRLETHLLEECVAFYTTHLGMTVLESWSSDGDKGAILALGTSTQREALLELAHVDVPRTYSGISLQFRVDDVAAVAQQLRGHCEFRGPKKRPWGSTYLYLEDPAGVAVILYEGAP